MENNVERQQIKLTDWLRTPLDYRRGNPDENTAELLLGFAGGDLEWTAVDVIDTGGR